MLDMFASNVEDIRYVCCLLFDSLIRGEWDRMFGVTHYICVIFVDFPATISRIYSP